MSRESESEQTQRTVAELLAQYGASAGDAPPRRRRRRAEDTTDTGPQAIIERVNSDSGQMKAVDPAVEPPPTRSGRRAKPDTDPDRTQYAAPVRPEPSQTDLRRTEPPPRVTPPKAAPPRVEPPKAAPPRAEPPRPSRPEPARADLSRPDLSRPDLSRLDPSRSDLSRPDLSRLDPHKADQPRSEPRRPEARRPGVPPVDPAEETRQVPPIVDEYSLPKSDPSRTAIPKPESSRANLLKTDPPSRNNLPKPDLSRGNPPKPDPSRPNLARPPMGPPPQPPVREAMTDLIPRVPAQPGLDDTQVTQSVPLLPPAPAKLPEPLPDARPEEWFGDDDEFAEQENTAAHPGPYVDDYSDNYSVDGFDPTEGPAGLADVDEDDEDFEEVERSPVKEWLVMIGQLAVGVLGGAVLWLGFNFLWRALPAAALVLALGVTVGLVLLVRKIRKADDLQTTLLAVLVGLIVTVSPAAMLLVKS
ncbi:hypothetical protein [Umezawaea tangerina]|uniref:Uncharacterized protein n=1 Tax=Umezawaea tangerina TaxID=84725 RepID=A0A2T0TCM8_9PSEU|nr:hypothetical protein [Umezawaea tangerina]PRY43394.1 hypothetical protein CLV43_103137 [Umezawaea tangerina]